MVERSACREEYNMLLAYGVPSVAVPIKALVSALVTSASALP
jgi:hypothetical protein